MKRLGGRRAVRSRCSTRAAGLMVGGILALAACGTTVPQQTQIGAAAAGTSAVDGSGVANPAAVTTGGGPAVSAPASQAVGAATVAGQQPGAVSGAVSAAGTPVTGTAAIGSRSTASAPVAGAAKTRTGSATTRTTATAKAPGKASATAKSSAAAVAPTTTAPIPIGILYDNPGAVGALNASLGASTNATINIKNTLEAFVKQINATGGLDGRMLAPVEVESSGDPDADCATLTQDNHVQVTVDALYGGAGDFASCMQKAGVEVIDLVSQTDAATLRATPNNVSLFRMSMDRAYGAVVTDLVKSGYVTPKNKIGVLMDTCSNSVAAYNNTVLPLFTSLGLDRTDTVTVSCTANTAGETSAISGSVLTFRGDNDDRIMIISDSEQQGLLLFGEEAGSQGYSPGYMLSSQSEASAVTPLLPAAERDGIHGVGNLPVFDITSPTNPNGSEEAGCVADMAKQNVVPASSDDYYYVYEGCAAFRLLARALAVNGAVTTPSVLASTFASLGSFTTPGIVGDAGVLSSSQQDAPSQVQNFAYSDSCSCLQYTSSPTPA